MKTKIFLPSALVLAVLFTATAIGAGEASADTGDEAGTIKPGTRVNVKVTKQAGDPIPDIDITLDQVLCPPHCAREMVMPGDNVRGGEKAKALEAFVNARATDPTDSDGDGYGNARIREGGHTIGAGTVAEIVKGFLSNSPIVIELPMSKGTVKFFNESKSVGGKVIDIVIRVNGSDI